MANTATSNDHSSTRAARSSRTSRKPLPPYLFLRRNTYYFKRKVPRRPGRRVSRSET